MIENLTEREKVMIENALRESGGLISGPTGAAAKLGLPRQTLESKIRKLGIDRHRLKRPRSFPISFANFSSIAARASIPARFHQA